MQGRSDGTTGSHCRIAADASVHSPLKLVPFSRARSCRRPAGAYIRNRSFVMEPNLTRDNHLQAQNSCITTSFPPEHTPSIFHPRRAAAIAARLRSPPVPRLSAMASAYSAYHGATRNSQFTVTALGRWSVLSKQLPGSSPCMCLFLH